MPLVDDLPSLVAIVAAEGQQARIVYSTTVWFLSDGRSVYLSLKPETAKYRNLRGNPAVAMSVGDLVRPDRYLEIRGKVIAFELFNTLAWVNQLAHKYTGAEFTGGRDGEHRYKVTIRVDAWTGQG